MIVKKSVSKRIISIVLTLFMIVASMICSAFTADAYSYDVEAAMKYASEHWNDGVGLCAEFVSACVSAGGLNVREAGTGGCARAVMRATGKSWSGSDSEYGYSLPQLKVDSNGIAWEGDNASIMQRGDVVVQWCNTHGIAPHIVICAGYSNGKAVYYAHNGALNAQSFNISRNTAYQHTTACDMVGRVIHISGSSAPAQPVSQDTGGPIADGTYYIATKLDTDYVLDVVNAFTEDGTNIQLYTNECVPQQQFNLKYKGNGYYTITAVHSGKAVRTMNGSMYANIVQTTLGSDGHFLWKPIATSNGYYLLQNKLGDMYMDVENAWAAQGTNIQLYPRNSAYDAQEWKFIPVNSVTIPFAERENQTSTVTPVVQTPAQTVVVEPTPVIQTPVVEPSPVVQTPSETVVQPVEEDVVEYPEIEYPYYQYPSSGRIILSIGSSRLDVNGTSRQIDNNGTCPVIMSGRTMLPIRAVIEGMGGYVSWNQSAQKVTLDYDDMQLNLFIGSAIAVGIDDDGEEVFIMLDSPAVISNGRTLLPIRAVIEFFGGNVNWYGDEQKVEILY